MAAMARRGHILAALLLAGACIALQGSLAQEVDGSTVKVTVFVEGTVQVFVSHGGDVVNGPGDAPTDYTYSLFDKPKDNQLAASVRVDFGSQASSLKTGDVVVAPVSLEMTRDQADALGLAAGDDTSSSGRRLLSEEHETARRMLLDFHNTRRSVAEFNSVKDILDTLQITIPGQVVKAANAKIAVVGSTAEKDLFVMDGKQQSISSLTFVFKSTACGLDPPLSAARVREHWYDKGNNAPISATLQRYYNVCTYDQLTFRPEENLVFDVDIPCVGSNSRGRYDLKNGNGMNNDNELFTLTELARKFLQRSNPAVANQWSSYRRKIMIFPFNWHTMVAPWAGLAMLGCSEGQDCFAWINSYMAQRDWLHMPTVFQELGHNIGLQHSSSMRCVRNSCSRDEYGDTTDPMGWVDPLDWDTMVVCTNAAQSYKAGWSKPIAGGHLNAFVDLRPGVAQEFRLPAMALNKNNMLRIVTDSTNSIVREPPASPVQRALFVSYRARQTAKGSYDSGLRFEQDGHVWVHEFNGTANGQPATIRDGQTMLLGGITDARGGNTSYTTETISGLGGIRIALKSKTAAAAVVTVCRFQTTSEAVGSRSCTDGIDNDCDGLVDSDDPDCKASSQQQSPPPLQRGASDKSPPRNRPPRVPSSPRPPRPPPRKIGK